MQVTPSIHALRHPFRIPAAPGIVLDRFVWSYIIFGETITLIDTGVAGCATQIFDEIRAAGRDPSEIALIVLTHAHPDHIGAAKTIRDATGCSIAAHPAERAWIEDTERQNRERPVPGFAMLVEGPVPVDFEIGDGCGIEPDDSRTVDLQVFDTPGHSPGSVSVWMQSEGALFSGDAIPVPGDLPIYDDALASLRSVRCLRRIRGVRYLLSAWDETQRDGDAYRRMALAEDYLRKIHTTVCAAAGEDAGDLGDITRKTAAALGLTLPAASPLLARTVSANLRAKDTGWPDEEPAG